MLASLLLMAAVATPVGQTRVTFLDDAPKARIRLVDDDDDHLDRDRESSSTRAARLESERPSFFGPIFLGVAGVGLEGIGVLALFVLNGGLAANLIYFVVPAAAGFIMIVCAVIWAIHRISERADYDERIKGLKGQSAEEWRAPAPLPMMTLARF